MSLLFSILIGYVLGAIPTGVIVAKLWCGADVRYAGSGHTGATNVARLTGNVWAGLITGLIDLGLGALSVYSAQVISDSPWAPVLAGPAAVLGHNWSICISLRGGIGLCSWLGMLLAQSSLAALVVALVFVAVWLGLRKILHHEARSTIIALLIVPLLLWVLGQPPHTLVSAVLGILLAIVKSVGDWGRAYELNEGVLGQIGLQQ